MFAISQICRGYKPTVSDLEYVGYSVNGFAIDYLLIFLQAKIIFVFSLFQS